MAEFCMQCSIEIFGEDYSDLCDLSYIEDTEEHKYTLTLCEGCGPCQVDHTGKCISVDCEKEHALWERYRYLQYMKDRG